MVVVPKIASDRSTEADFIAFVRSHAVGREGVRLAEAPFELCEIGANRSLSILQAIEPRANPGHSRFQYALAAAQSTLTLFDVLDACFKSAQTRLDLAQTRLDSAKTALDAVEMHLGALAECVGRISEREDRNENFFVSHAHQIATLRRIR